MGLGESLTKNTGSTTKNRGFRGPILGAAFLQKKTMHFPMHRFLTNLGRLHGSRLLILVRFRDANRCRQRNCLCPGRFSGFLVET